MIDDVYSLLQTGLMPQNNPAPQVLEQVGVLVQPVEPSPVDSGLGYPIDFCPTPQGNKPSGTYTEATVSYLVLQDVSYDALVVPKNGLITRNVDPKRC